MTQKLEFWRVLPFISVPLSLMALLFSVSQVVPAVTDTFSWPDHLRNANFNALQVASMLAEPNPEAQAGKIETVARQALKNAPLNAVALSGLGLSREMQGAPKAEVLGLLQLSQKVSRRDSIASIWLIDHFASNNDLTSVLTAYDRTLTVHPTLGELLYPVLTNALSDSEVQRGLAAMLKRRPAWQYAALSFAVLKGRAVEVADVLRQTGQFPDTPDAAQVEMELLTRLVADGQIEVARAAYLRMRRSNPKIFSSLALDPTTTLPSRQPISWTTSSTDDFDSRIVSDASAGQSALSASVNPLKKSEVARKLLIVDAGRYDLTSDVVIEGGDRTAASLRLDCVGQGGTAKAVELVLPNGVVTQPIQIAGGCRGHIAVVQFDSGDSQQASELLIRSLKLSKSGQ